MTQHELFPESYRHEGNLEKRIGYVYTGCAINSELITNKNNILLEVIDTNFSTSQFTMVLHIFLHSFTFCVQCLLGGHHPPQRTGTHSVKKLRLTA